MYRHERVVDIMHRAKRVVRHLFEAYLAEPSALPREQRPEDEDEDDAVRARNICDFVAGMTDRYAMEEHKRLFDLDPLFR